MAIMVWLCGCHNTVTPTFGTMVDTSMVCSRQQKTYAQSMTYLYHFPKLLNRFLVPAYSYIHTFYGLWLLFSICDLSFSLFAVLVKGYSHSPCYRFMNRSGDWVWVRSKSHVTYDSVTHLPNGLSIYTWIVRWARQLNKQWIVQWITLVCVCE